MSNKQKTTPPIDTGGMTTVVYGDAVALGEDTSTSVDVSVQTKVKNNGATVTKGTVVVVAESESPDGYANATTGIAVSGADSVTIKTKDKSGGDGDSSYDTSIMKCKVIDSPYESGGPEVIEKTQEKYDSSDVFLDLDGNIAIATFDAEVIGQDTLVSVDAYVLAIEDELSLSTIMITSAVG
jgi:hypothetical protein